MQQVIFESQGAARIDRTAGFNCKTLVEVFDEFRQVGIAVIVGAQPPTLLPDVILTAILGFGLGFVAWQRRNQ